jgi:GNAT superfamily N-acetyltransferase
MPEQKLTIRLYQDGDEQGIVKLFKEIFNREMTIEEWRWKYTGQGNKKVYSSVAVNETNEVIAHYGGIPHRMIYHGKEIHGLSIGDVIVHPAFRGLKLFKKAAEMVPDEAVRDGFILGYGFPNERALLLPEKLGLYEKVEYVFEAQKDVTFHNNLNRFSFKFFPLRFVDGRIDILWETAKKELKLSVVRDREYLSWRYQRHPFSSYELWGLRKRWGKRLEGIAVLRREDERMLIIDFLCPLSIIFTLSQKIENYAFTLGEKKLILWHPEYLSLRLSQMGFSIKPTGICIPRTTHEKTLTKDEMAGIFFYTMGDTDFL